MFTGTNMIQILKTIQSNSYLAFENNYFDNIFNDVDSEMLQFSGGSATITNTTIINS